MNTATTMKKTQNSENIESRDGKKSSRAAGRLNKLRTKLIPYPVS
jgi:hypothetical protein